MPRPSLVKSLSFPLPGRKSPSSSPKAAIRAAVSGSAAKDGSPRRCPLKSICQWPFKIMKPLSLAMIGHSFEAAVEVVRDIRTLPFRIVGVEEIRFVCRGLWLDRRRRERDALPQRLCLVGHNARVRRAVVCVRNNCPRHRIARLPSHHVITLRPSPSQLRDHRLPRKDLPLKRRPIRSFDRALANFSICFRIKNICLTMGGFFLESGIRWSTTGERAVTLISPR